MEARLLDHYWWCSCHIHVAGVNACSCRTRGGAGSDAGLHVAQPLAEEAYGYLRCINRAVMKPDKNICNIEFCRCCLLDVMTWPQVTAWLLNPSSRQTAPVSGSVLHHHHCVATLQCLDILLNLTQLALKSLLALHL